jgi:hypothetical protein
MFVEYEVITAVAKKSTVFWVVTPCSTDFPHHFFVSYFDTKSVPPKRQALPELHGVATQNTYPSYL